MPTERSHPDTAPARRTGYLELSRRPLHILAFLLPALLLYELGSILYLTDPTAGQVKVIEAQGILAGFFRTFGAAGLHLPAVALVAVLLVQHTLLRHRWRIRWRALPLMAAESGVLTLPLLLLAMLATAAPLAGVAADVAALPWQARATIALGAGLYEELLFRMILIEAIHLIAADLLRLGQGRSRIAAVVLSAIAFAVYHDLSGPTGSIDPAKTAFMIAAGLYFGVLYVARGFGIAVGVHAVYDLVVLVAIASDAAPAAS